MDEPTQPSTKDEATALDARAGSGSATLSGDQLPARDLTLPVYRPGRLSRAALASVVIAAAVGAAGYALTPAGAALGYVALALTVAVAAALVAVCRWGVPMLPWPFAATLGAVGGVGGGLYLSWARGSMSTTGWLMTVVVGAALGVLAGWAGDRPRSVIETYLAGYRVEGVLGSGASGSVYRALDPKGHRVAIKVLASAWLDDVEFRDRLRAEAAVMYSLDHPNCVHVYDVIDAPDFAALVTEYVDGATLQAVLATAGRLTGPQSAKVMSGALRGLAHVHDRGMIHRDVKPANIAVDRQGRSRLLDYGIARRVNDDDDQVAGTPAYMSPEQIAGEPLDARSDVYACGAILFELLTGRRPYPAESPVEVMAAHWKAPVPDPAALQHDIDRGVAALVVSALAKQPAQRPQGAEEFRRRLEEEAERAYGTVFAGVSVAGLATLGAAMRPSTTTAGQPTIAPGDAKSVRDTARRGWPGRRARYPEVEPGPRLRRPARRRWRGVIAAGVAVLAVAAVLAIGLTARRRTTTTPPPRPVLDACLIGTWVRTAGAYDDVWNGIPVLVRYPGGGDPARIRYSADGRYTYVAPVDGPAATGRLKGATFIDKSYGVETGHWHTAGAHEVVESGSDDSFTQVLYAGYQHASSPATSLQSGAVPLRVTCSTHSFTEIDNFTYHGKRITSHITYRREPNGFALPSSSVPNQHKLIGGVNLDGYCRNLGGSAATSTKPLTGAHAAIGNWTCVVHGVTHPIDMNGACQWTHPAAQNETARAIDPSSAFTWLCYGDPAPTLRISPTSGGVGTTITVTSLDPCPPTTTGLMLSLGSARPSPIQTGSDLPLPHGGQWHSTLTVGPFGAVNNTIPAVTAQVNAYCQLPHNLYVEYRHQPFHFTGHP